MRGISPDQNAEGSNYDNFHITYDEYPMIVPKRAALLLDRLMVALHHAMENGGELAPGELEKDKVSKMNPHRKIVQQYLMQHRLPKEAASAEDSRLLDKLKDYDVDLNPEDLSRASNAPRAR
ncbi:uncharacterized protein LOC132259932 isoform X2 [Phlebotomus argentipes]|uniref:uncharacterized protein LOC132259932 isoform X2 n=1 Tax=Phlebotomus argentipes TaxID=94469 RepID=UPI0028930548|nr:uncharacterized protein LOC132259932 isoform X2 [Phlebotomus argentipes]